MMARDESTQLPVARRSHSFGDQLVEPLSRLRDEVDRLFDDFPLRMSAFPFGRLSGRITVPAVEMTETDTAFKLSAELPGMNPEEVEVTVENGVLCISGEKKEEREEKERGLLLTERSYGAFERRIELPQGADAEKIKADFKNGVLKILLPKDAKIQEQKRKIDINQA